MSSTTMNYPQQSNSPVKFILCSTVLIVFAVTYGLHAVAKHGTKANIVRECIERNGPIETWNNPSTGRIAKIACTDNGKFGIQVCNKSNKCEITSFLKEKLTKIEDVYRYLRNRGYEPLDQ